MNLLDELLTYPEDERRSAWESYLDGDGDNVGLGWNEFMSRWGSHGNPRLMVLIRRGRYSGVDPTDPEASRARLR